MVVDRGYECAAADNPADSREPWFQPVLPGTLQVHFLCAHGWRRNRVQEASSGHRGFLLRNVNVFQTCERILQSRRHLNGAHQHGQDGPVPYVGEPQFSFDVHRFNGSRREQDEEDVGTFDAADNLRLPACAGLNSGPVDPYLVSAASKHLAIGSTSDASCLE